MEEYRLNSPEDTIAFGEEFAKREIKHHVIAIEGDLGAGKTHFSKGFCSAFGVTHCSSPTYSLIHEYMTSEISIFHFDFYRLNHEDELWEIGWDDYLEREGVVIVEWANLFPHAFPKETVWIKIRHEEQGRKLTIITP